MAVKTLLRPEGIVVVPATTTPFIAKEKFVCDIGRKAKVKIRFLGGNFSAWFLDGDGKIEDPMGEQTLRYHTLLEHSVDGPIIAGLGGEAKVETTLTALYFLMEKQGHGEDGEDPILLNNGCANIFDIKDLAQVLCAVYVYWRHGGWGVGAGSVEYSSGWLDGSRVFSRK